MSFAFTVPWTGNGQTEMKSGKSIGSRGRGTDEIDEKKISP